MEINDHQITTKVTGTLSAIILTFNEEKNIEACLKSISLLNAEIFIVDSGSTDDTLNICRKYTENIVHNPWHNYGNQRNWALKNLPITTPWVINIDADHRVTGELASELKDILSKPVNPEINGFLVSRRTIFMGRWIKYGGHYPTYHAIIFRYGSGQCEDKLYDQHFKVTGKTSILKSDIIDIIADSISSFTIRHNQWANLEAQYQLNKQNEEGDSGIVKGRLFGNPIERRRYVKKIYERFPLFMRPAIYFTIRYFFKLGFLDGREGLIFHFLQGFWFRFLIDAKIYELKKLSKSNEF